MDKNRMTSLVIDMLRNGTIPAREVFNDFLQDIAEPNEIAELFHDNELQADKLKNLAIKIEKDLPSKPYDIFCYVAELNQKSEKIPKDFNNLIRALSKKVMTGAPKADEMLNNALELRDKSFSQAVMIQTHLPLDIKKEIEPLLNKFYSRSEMVLAARLDIAYEIYTKTNKFLTQQNSTATTELLDLKQKTLDFMQTVLNINDEKNLVQLLQERQQKSKTDSEFIPNRQPQLTKLKNIIEATKATPDDINKNDLTSQQKDRARYNLQRLAQTGLAQEQKKIVTVNADSKAEDVLHATKFLTPEQRDKHRAIIYNGEILERQADNTFTKADTSSRISHLKDDYAAFVLNLHGELSLFDHFDMADKMAHSSMNAQSAVLSAGELKIENGIIKELTAHSGHYRPFEKNIYEALKYFTQQGVDISQMNVHLITQDGEFDKPAAQVYAEMDKLAKLPQLTTPAKNSTASIMGNLSSQNNNQDPLLALLQQGTVSREQITNELGRSAPYSPPKIDIRSQEELQKDFSDTRQYTPPVR